MCEAAARIGVKLLMLGAGDIVGAEIMSRWGKNGKRTDDAVCAGAEMIIMCEAGAPCVPLPSAVLTRQVSSLHSRPRQRLFLLGAVMLRPLLNKSGEVRLR